MNDNWAKLLKLLKGRSPLGEALRAVIYYVIGLLALYVVGLVNYTAWALLTVLLLVVSFSDFAKVSEASLRYLRRRFPAALATLIVAYLLGQTLDYVFGVLFFVFLFVRIVERYL